MKRLDPEALVATVGALITLVAVFQQYTSVWAFPRFVLAAVVLFWLPGRFVLDVADLHLGFVEGLSLSTLLGTIASGAAYWLLASAGVGGWLLAWPVVISISWFWVRHRRSRPVPTGRRFRPEHNALVIVIALALLPLAALEHYWPNVTQRSDGTIAFSTIKDAIFHLAIAQELTSRVPPQVPWLSGVDLSYHYGADLIAAASSRFADLSLPDVTFRFLPALFIVVLALAAFAFARAWLDNGLAAAGFAALVLFAEDFSFVPGLLLGTDSTWTSAFFFTPTVYSLYFLNPMLPALALLMGSLLCLVRYAETRRLAWAAIFALLTAALVEIKIFVAFHLILALALAALLPYRRRRSTLLLRPLVLSGVLAGPLALLAYLQTTSNPNEVHVTTAAQRLNYMLNALSLDTFGSHRATLVLVGFPLFVGGSLGMRLLAIPALLSRRFRVSEQADVRLVLVVFVLSGLALGTFTKIEAFPGSYDNSVWFYVAAKYVLWIFVLECLVALWRRRPVLALVGVCGAFALSIPATLQFFESAPRDPGNHLSTSASLLGPKDVELLSTLDSICRHREIALAPEQLVAPIVGIAGCRVPYLGLNSEYLTDEEDLARRMSNVRDFWSDWSRGRCRWDILKTYGVELVVGPRMPGRPPPDCGASRLRVEKVEPTAIVFRVVPDSLDGSSERPLHQ